MESLIASEQMEDAPSAKRFKFDEDQDAHRLVSNDEDPSRSLQRSPNHEQHNTDIISNEIKTTEKTNNDIAVSECGGSEVGVSDSDDDEDDADYSQEESEPRYQVDLPPLDQSQREVLIDEARNLGFWPWLEKFSNFHLKSLFQIFNVELPDGHEIATDEELLPILRRVFMEKASRRQKRPDINTIEDVINLLQKSERILIITGAGCSVSCGIPDFRSKNGIYSRLDEFELEDPQQMFDIDYFRFRPETFYSFAKEIYPSNFQPSPSHNFIKLLESKGKLLRNYTQNIDTLEQKAGITRVIQCHGSFATASCIICGHSMQGNAIEEDIFAQRVPRCVQCPEDVDGIIKPDITFFGQKLPIEFDMAFAEDKNKADLLIVIGSSLKVSPVADVKEKLPQDIPQILINLEALPHMEGFDVQLLGYCDTIVSYLCKKLGWELPGAVHISEEIPIRPGRFHHQYLFEGAVEHSSDSEEELSFEDSEEDSDDVSESDSGDDNEHVQDPPQDQTSADHLAKQCTTSTESSENAIVTPLSSEAHQYEGNDSEMVNE